MEKMEKPLSNSPFSPFSAMNFDHRMTYVAAYLGDSNIFVFAYQVT